MGRRHLVQRISPQFDRRWLIGVLVVGTIVAVGAFFIRINRPVPPLELLALGPSGAFEPSIDVPASLADSATGAPDAVARVPLVLGVRNPGTEPLTPRRLILNLPTRFRLADASGRDMPASADPSSPLLRYQLEPPFEPIEPQRLPSLLPAHDTIWLEITMPSFHCVAATDSVPDFVVAHTPPISTLQDLRVFYVFQGGDLPGRHSGILQVALDSALFRHTTPQQPPSFPVEADREAANPDVGPAAFAGGRNVQCGEPGAPMALVSTAWDLAGGGRMYALKYGSQVRKRLYDVDGDGVIERESWDPDGDGEFDATRRTRMPVPEFLLPIIPMAPDSMLPDSLAPDSLAPTDPFGRPLPDSLRRDTAGAAPATDQTPDQPTGTPQPAQPAPDTTTPQPQPEPEPEPEPEPDPSPSQPLGRPIPR